MESNPVGWFEIYVDDMERGKKFYETVFGVKLEKLPGTDIEMWSFPMKREGTGAAGALVRIKGFPAGRNSVVVYFSCRDCAVEEKKARENGGRIDKSKFSIGPYGFISLVHDTEGNLIGLHSRS